MTKREETPDVLGKLLGERPAAPPAPAGDQPAESQDAGKATGQQASKPARQRAGKTGRRQASKPAPPPESGEKVKATFYMDAATLDSLDAAWLQLRRLAGTDKRGSVSKSLIVEMALSLVLQDLRDNKEESQLARMLAEL